MEELKQQEKQIVDGFSLAMFNKIQTRHNRFVPLGWKTMDSKRLLQLLAHELSELKEAHEEGDADKIRDEAIDVANYAMFIYEQTK